MNILDTIRRRQTTATQAAEDAEAAGRREYRDLLRRCLINGDGSEADAERLADLAQQCGRSPELVALDAEDLMRWDAGIARRAAAQSPDRHDRYAKLRAELAEKHERYHRELAELRRAVEQARVAASAYGATAELRLDAQRNPWLLQDDAGSVGVKPIQMEGSFRALREGRGLGADRLRELGIDPATATGPQ